MIAPEVEAGRSFRERAPGDRGNRASSAIVAAVGPRGGVDMGQARWLCAALMAVMTAVGPLGSAVTMAQTTSSGPTTSGPGSTTVHEPMQPEAAEGVREPPSTGAKVGAGVLNGV